jgi:hypothetical protein
VDGGDGVFVEATEGDETDRLYHLYGDNGDKETNRRREEKEEESLARGRASLLHRIAEPLREVVPVVVVLE